MAGRIVLFGATGYTGRLTAEALVARGARPLLAARNGERLRGLAEELGGLEHQPADVSEPATVAALVNRGDVLISTVGPFARWGEAAARAAVDAGAHYLDSTGEGVFVRRVFEEFGPVAAAADCGLLTSFGADWVPGNLAGGLALRDAGEAARRVEIGYFITGSGSAMSGGTRASGAGMMLDPGFAWHDGRIVAERGAARVMSFEVNGRQRPAISVAASEHFALPRLSPALHDVDVYLGWFGALTRPVQVFSLATAGLVRVPGVEGALRGATERLVKGSSGGPDARQRAKSGLHCVAIARGETGEPLATVHLEGANAYDFTAAILAWGATTALRDGLQANGALGPVDAFGLEALQAGCSEAGLQRV